MIEPPTVYEINPPYDELETQMQKLSESISEGDRERTPDGNTVIQSILDDISGEGKVEIHKFGVKHVQALAEKENMQKLISITDNWTEKEWSEDEKNQFQEILEAN